MEAPGGTLACEPARRLRQPTEFMAEFPENFLGLEKKPDLDWVVC